MSNYTENTIVLYFLILLQMKMNDMKSLVLINGKRKLEISENVMFFPIFYISNSHHLDLEPKKFVLFNLFF